jgi:hypothetical protein
MNAVSNIGGPSLRHSNVCNLARNPEILQFISPLSSLYPLDEGFLQSGTLHRIGYFFSRICLAKTCLFTGSSGQVALRFLVLELSFAPGEEMPSEARLPEATYEYKLSFFE